MGIDFNDAEGIEPDVLEQAKQGEATMKNTVATSNDSLKISGGSGRGGGGGGGDGDLPFDQVLAKSNNDLTKVKQIIAAGGFTGPDKDKYTLSLHHAEWIKARNEYMTCPNYIKEKSVKYTALVNGKATNQEIITAHREWTDIRDKCRKSGKELIEKAEQYVETDRRVRANLKAEGDIYPTIQGFQVGRNDDDERDDQGLEGFTSIKEGFDFYTGSSVETNTDISGTSPAIKTYNARMPLLNEKNISGMTSNNGDDKTILPWNQYYIDCDAQDESSRPSCRIAMNKKNDYITATNVLFKKAELLLNTYYKLTNTAGGSNAEINKLLLDSEIKSVLENQQKDIDLYKQNALYDYDEYNSLSFYEDMVAFLYYAVFIIFVGMTLRDLFSSSSGGFDKRNLIILIVFAIYPKFILPVVLWILNGLTKLTELLGLKNIRFWA